MAHASVPARAHGHTITPSSTASTASTWMTPSATPACSANAGRPARRHVRHRRDARRAGSKRCRPDRRYAGYQSTATRFEWGNRPPASETISPTTMVRAASTSSTPPMQAQAFGLARAEGQTTSSVTAATHSCAGEPPMVSDVSAWRGRARRRCQRSTPMLALTSLPRRRGFLGPGQRAGGFYKAPPTSACGHFTTQQRGGALVAVRSVNGEPVEIAHIAINDGGERQGRRRRSPSRPSSSIRSLDCGGYTPLTLCRSFVGDRR